MGENSFNISSNQTEKSFGCQRRISSFWNFIAAIFISHTNNDAAENLTLHLINCFEFCVFTKVMRCGKYTTALVYKMITIICCTHCDCMLPVRKKFCAFYRSACVKRLRNTVLSRKTHNVDFCMWSLSECNPKLWTLQLRIRKRIVFWPLGFYFFFSS